MRKFGLVLSSLAVLYLVLVVGLAVAMRQPPARFGKLMARMPGPMFLVLPFESLWKWARAGALKPGDAAPQFTLATLDRKSRVSLAEHRGARPVVLVFGSYT